MVGHYYLAKKGILKNASSLIKGLGAGADDYLIKPINFDVLFARINAMHRIAVMQASLFGILENVFNGIITIDGKGIISAFNKAAETIFGYTPQEVMGKNVKMLMPTPYCDEHDMYLQRYARGGQPHIIGTGRKVFGQRKNGNIFPMDLAITELRCEKGNIFIGVIRDISVEEVALAEIKHLALHDPLTKLPNRAYLNQVLETLLEDIDHHVSAVFFIDLDGFKPINDQLGHEAGDQALCHVANNLRNSLDKNCFIGRLGGDEFVVVLPCIENNDIAMTTGQKIIAAIAQPMRLLDAQHPCQLRASVGLAFIPHDGKTCTQILTAADNAMYEAKRTGKNIVVCSPERTMT